MFFRSWWWFIIVFDLIETIAFLWNEPDWNCSIFYQMIAICFGVDITVNKFFLRTSIIKTFFIVLNALYFYPYLFSSLMETATNLKPVNIKRPKKVKFVCIEQTPRPEFILPASKRLYRAFPEVYWSKKDCA